MARAAGQALAAAGCYTWGMAMLWAQTVKFDAVQPGDTLPLVIKWETEASIRRANVRLLGGGGETETPEGETPAELPFAVLEEYVVELLEKGFPPERVAAPESGFTLEMTEAVKAGDIISLSGRVVSKRLCGELGMVECQVTVAAVQDSAVETGAAERVIGRAAARVALESLPD